MSFTSRLAAWTNCKLIQRSDGPGMYYHLAVLQIYVLLHWNVMFLYWLSIIDWNVQHCTLWPTHPQYSLVFCPLAPTLVHHELVQEDKAQRAKGMNSILDQMFYHYPSAAKDSQYVAAETQATSLTESYAPQGPTGKTQWGHVTELTATTPTSDPSTSAPSTQVQWTLRALGCPQPYLLSWVWEGVHICTNASWRRPWHSPRNWRHQSWCCILSQSKLY